MRLPPILTCGLLLVGILLSRTGPAVAEDEFRFPSQRIASSISERRVSPVSRFWERLAARSPVQHAGFEGEAASAVPPITLCGHSGTENGKDNDKLPSWREAGTLFRWSFDKASGGPELDKPLVTDRPDFTEASSTVGRGVAQLEMGYAYTYDREGGVSVRSQSLGEPLLRYGIVANWLEFRTALFPVAERIVEAGRRNSTAGTEDLYLGLKIGLTPGEGPLPEMALIPQMTVPTGSPRFTDDEVLPGVNWLYSWEINDRISTGGSSQFNRVLDEGTGRAYFEYSQSWTVGIALDPARGVGRETSHVFFEWFAMIPHSADTAQPKHFFNFGFTYLISNDIQLDIRYGIGLNRAAEDYFVGTGLSIRFK